VFSLRIAVVLTGYGARGEESPDPELKYHLTSPQGKEVDNAL
jgi:hypothetical protein